ncbi:MAG: hypothetical protein J5J00_08715 [Deltaproteobacteria bacterium]|nr:hypothetical protein [Deltaproteobacteria bacterium]
MEDKKTTLAASIEREQSSSENVAAEQPKNLSASIEKSRAKKKSYLMDLRIHSPASLGYLGIEGIDTAPALVRLAKVKGLDVIAVTDFYSAAYIDRVIDAARNTSLIVIPGVDLRVTLKNCDDVILSCLFPESSNAQAIHDFLRALGVPSAAMGNRKYLVSHPFDHVLSIIDEFGAVALPSRMDKTPHRLAVLPQLVETYGFRAFDLAYADSVSIFRSRWPKIKFQLFSFSNANALAQVGSRMARVKMPDPGFAGIKHLVARQSAESSPAR